MISAYIKLIYKSMKAQKVRLVDPSIYSSPSNSEKTSVSADTLDSLRSLTSSSP